MVKYNLVNIVRDVGDCLLGLNFVQADQAIDEMRRFIYAARFSGDDHAVLREHLKPSEPALKGISILAPLAIAEVEKVAFELRYHIWTSSFAAIPTSAFAQNYLSHVEAARQAEARGTAAGRHQDARKAKPSLAVVQGGRLH